MLEEEQIQRAQELEIILSTYKLWSNMIPKTTWYTNLRNILPKKEWMTIRKSVLEYYHYQCSICGTKIQLHAHESWSYDYKLEKQILQDIQALCYYCHMIQHIGFVQVQLIPAGELTMDEIEHHWLTVNTISDKKEFKKMLDLAFELWDIRSAISWRVYDQNGVVLSEL